MAKDIIFYPDGTTYEIKTYNDEMRWDSYYFEGYQHDPEPHTLEEAGEAYFDDKDFMLEAVKIDAYCLKYASERLKNNKIIVKAATKSERFADYVFEFIGKKR